MKLTLSTHTQERLSRIAERDRRIFVSSLAKAQHTLPLSGGWAVKVVFQGRILGYAVGINNQWKTILSSGQSPSRGDKIFIWIV